MHLFFENDFITLRYDKKKRLGRAQWRGYLKGPELREAYLLGLELVDRFSLTRWLADDRLMYPVDEADVKWSLDVFVPQIATSSLLRMTRLPSYSERNLEAIDVMIDKGLRITDKLTLRDFYNEQEAMDWLMEPL